MLLFSSFMLYDDEGYILLSLRNQSEHGALYTEVYSQYGPFFYAALGGFSKLLAFEWDNTSGRWLTLFNWLTASVLCGLLVWRLRQLWTIAMLTTVGVFVLLWTMLQEPGHPGGLLTLLVALTALLSCEAIHGQKSSRLAVLLGISGALTALIKINVGAFLVIAGTVWLLTGQAGRLRGLGQGMAFLVVIVVPFAVMRSLMGHEWVVTFAVLASLSGLSAALVANQTPLRDEQPIQLPLFIGAGVMTTLAVVAWCLAQGTSLAGQWEGIISEPLRHPGIYSFPVNWRPGVVAVAIVGLGLVFAWVMRPRSLIVRHLIATTRIVAVAGMLFALLPWVGTSLAALALCYGLPLAGIFAIPLRPDDISRVREAHCRAWLALMLVLQALQAFPIAGSQLNWGTFLCIPLLLLSVVDALQFWSENTRYAAGKRTRQMATVAIGLITLVPLVQLSRIGWQRIHDGAPLGLPGAEKIVLPLPIASALHIIATNAKLNASLLFSLPGSYSFNLWTDRPTPTLRNVTHWFSILSESEQQKIITTMQAEPGAAFVLQRPQISSLREKGFHVNGPLVSYLQSNYHSILRMDGHELWVQKELKTNAFQVLTPETQAHPAEIRRIGVNLPAYKQPIARIEVYYHTTASVLRGSTATGELEDARLQSLDADGHASGPSQPVIWPLPPAGMCRLTMNWPHSTEGNWIFHFVATDGSTVGFARFAH